MRTLLAPVGVVVLLLGSGGIATATDADASITCSVTWQGPAGGAWEQPASWSTGRVPRPDDSVCLGGAASVTLHASTTVTAIDVGSSQLTVASGVTLRVPTEVDVGGGTLAGPGTVRLGDPDATACCSSQLFLGSSRLARGIHLVAFASVATVAGPLTFGGGSVLTSSSYLTLDEGADFVDGDGAAGNAFVQSSSPWSELVVTHDVTVGVTATLGGIVSGAGDLDLPRLTNETPEGVLRGFRIRNRGTVTVPYPVTALQDAGVDTPQQLIAATTGQAAVSTLRTVESSFFAMGPADYSHGLVFSRSNLSVFGAPSVPALTLTDASAMTVQVDGSLRVRRGAGTLSVRRDTAAGPVHVLLYYGTTIDGSLAQHGGILEVFNGGNSARITGDWTLDAGAQASLTVARWRGSVPSPRLTVQGTTSLAGSLVVSLQSTQDPPPVGTVIRLVTTRRGGLTGAFSHVTLPAGYALSYDATGVLVTRTA